MKYVVGAVRYSGGSKLGGCCSWVIKGQRWEVANSALLNHTALLKRACTVKGYGGIGGKEGWWNHREK